MEQFVDTFFKPSILVSTWPAIAKGMLVTIEIAILVVITGLALGLFLAVLRTLRYRLLDILIIVFVDFFRAIPPLVAVLLIFFGLPNVGINLPSFAVLWLVLSLVLTEIGRASCRERV